MAKPFVRTPLQLNFSAVCENSCNQRRAQAYDSEVMAFTVPIRIMLMLYGAGLQFSCNVHILTAIICPIYTDTLVCVRFRARTVRIRIS